MSGAFTIRRAAAADAQPLIEFNRAMARETENKDLPLEIVSAGVRAALEDARHGFYVVVERGSEIAGALMITYEWSDWRNRVFWLIQSVYVRPAFRRQGVYRLLYDFVKREAARAGNVCGFRLYVEKENAVAQKVYASLGMSESHYVMFEEAL